MAPRFSGFVHPLVRAVLLRVRGQDALVLNAQAQPPHVERREAMQRRRREGHAVVGAHRQREAVLAEEAIEDRPHARCPRVERSPWHASKKRVC